MSIESAILHTIDFTFVYIISEFASRKSRNFFTEIFTEQFLHSSYNSETAKVW